LEVLPPTDPKLILCQQAESCIVAMAMDDLNNEGICGTVNGSLQYLNIGENQQIRLVSRVANGLEKVNQVKFDLANQAVFLASSGEMSGDVKLYTTATLDQVNTFQHHNESPVRFICGYNSKQQKKFKMIGHADGELCLITLDALKVEFSYTLENLLNENEELSVGTFSPFGMNFAVGTTKGNVFIGQFKKDM
jgi:hypothetical protein